MILYFVIELFTPSQWSQNISLIDAEKYSQEILEVGRVL
jgi:hypothetical protein